MANDVWAGETYLRPLQKLVFQVVASSQAEVLQLQSNSGHHRELSVEAKCGLLLGGICYLFDCIQSN